MKSQLARSIAAALTLVCAAHSSFAAGPVVSDLIPQEQKSGYMTLAEAQKSCQASGSRYLRQVSEVVCEPTVQTNIRRLKWNQIVQDRVYAGKLVSRSSYSSSWADSVSATFQQLSVFLSSSGSESSSHYNETAVYDQVSKTMGLYRDEVVETYGYNLLISTQKVQANTAPAEELVRSKQKFASEKAALEACATVSLVMYGFKYDSQCQTSVEGDASFGWILIGKPALVTVP